jgi:uncharacterized repeat protein (TIGR01451 family)
LLNFYLVNSSTGVEQALNPAPINTCSLPRRFVTVTHDGNTYSFTGKSINATRPILNAAAGNMRLRMRNSEQGTTGNDGAVDNFRLLDVTPQLDKQFERGTLANDAHEVNASVRMIFTITNRQDLLVKTGWGFVETLPNGLQFAANPNVAHTCAAATTSISGNRLTVSNGSLAARAASCTISVDVTSTTAGTYTNQPSDISSLIGLDPPASATVTFINNVTLRVRKVFSNGRVYPSDQLRLRVLPHAEGGASADVTTTGSTNNPPEVATVTNAVPGLQYTLQETIAAGSTSTGSEYDYSYSCTNTRPDGQTPSGASWSFVLTPAPGDDLTCTFTNTAKPVADLQIVKTADRSSFRTGEIVVYTLAVTNAGPSAANNAVLRDAPAPGLDCTEASLPPLTCEAAGGAACPSPLTSAGLTGTAGVTVPTFPAGGSLTVRMSCRVTASGTP